MSNDRKLRAYARFDANGRIIPGSLILSRFKPKVGNYVEQQTYECCDVPNRFLLLEDSTPEIPQYLLQENDGKIKL